MEQQTLRLNVLVAAGLVAWYLSALLTTMHLVGVVFAGGVFGLVMLAYFWILGLVRSDTRVGGFFASSTFAYPLAIFVTLFFGAALVLAFFPWRRGRGLRGCVGSLAAVFVQGAT